MEETQERINRPLPIGNIFKKAFRFLFCQNQQFWIWVVILCLVSFVITRAGNYFVLTMLADLPIKVRIGISAVLGGLGNGLVFTLLAIACHRMILLEEQNNRWTKFFQWSHRGTRFFMWSFLIYLGTMFILLHSIFIGSPIFLQVEIDFVKDYLVFMAYSLLDWLMPKIWIPTMWIFIFGMGVPIMKYLIFLYTTSRVSLVLPAIAIDVKPTLSWAWGLSKGNGWRLVLLTAIPMIVYSFGGSILNGVTMRFPFDLITGIVESAWSVFFVIVEVSLFSEVYKELSAPH